MPDYPKYFPTVVGLSPSTMKHVKPADLKALCEAFLELTTVEPLHPSASIAEAWEAWRKKHAPSA